MLGIEQDGVDHLHEGVSVLFRAPIWHIAGEHRYGIYGITHPEAAGTLLPAGGDRWVYAFEWDPARERLQDYTVDRLSHRIRHATGESTVEPRIAHVGAVTFGAFMAERFRDESAFLVGDAAHRITPRGGTGMNLAIADGYDLGWKLGWVLRGWSIASLLDTYEAERRPAAEHNLERSMDPMGSRRTAADEVHVDLGGRLTHVWLPRHTVRRRRSTFSARVSRCSRSRAARGERAVAELEVDVPIDVRSARSLHGTRTRPSRTAARCSYVRTASASVHGSTTGPRAPRSGPLRCGPDARADRCRRLRRRSGICRPHRSTSLDPGRQVGRRARSARSCRRTYLDTPAARRHAGRPGGAWLGPKHDRIFGLAARSVSSTYKTWVRARIYSSTTAARAATPG